MFTEPDYPGGETGLKKKYRQQRVHNFIKNLATLILVAAVFGIIAFAASRLLEETGQTPNPFWRIFQ
jgi:hypothetical protein